jgi:hypothetical protein
MRCIRVHRASRYAPCAAAMFALGLVAQQGRGQQPIPPPNYPVYPQPYPIQPMPIGNPSGQQVLLPAYHAPSIVLAAPTEGAALPMDKPVAVLRFTSSEPLDPIDALSFSVSLDAQDKTRLFQMSQGEAWGPLIAPGETIVSGQHEVAARICTSHGACGTVKATVIVAATAPTQIASTKTSEKAKDAKNKVWSAVLQAARALLH